MEISEHYSILLQFDTEKSSLNYPFKFCHVWLEDETFKRIVRDYWSMFERWDMVKLWRREKRNKLHEELCNIGEELVLLYQSNSLGVFSYSELDRISNLKCRKNDIPGLEEEYWRLKSKAV